MKLVSNDFYYWGRNPQPPLLTVVESEGLRGYISWGLAEQRDYKVASISAMSFSVVQGFTMAKRRIVSP